LVLLLPFAKWRVPQRPSKVPGTAAFANGKGAGAYWIDCWNIVGDSRFSCTVYRLKSGDTFLKGVFQQIATDRQQRVFYDGGAIHWKHGELLRPFELECVAGGRPPRVPDCR
jgi:hypothetical protein